MTQDDLAPSNMDAEEAVLGSILIDREAIALVLPILKPEHFYRARHQVIYRAMVAIYEKGDQVDYLTMVSELERTNKYEDAGGLAYLSNMLSVVPTSTHVENYAKMVRDTAMRRRLIQVAGKAAQLAYTESYEEAYPKVLRLLYESQDVDITGLIDGDEFGIRLTNYWTSVTSGEVTGVETGLVDVDKYLRGLCPGRLYVIGARASMGKTSLALTIADNAAKQGKHVLFASSEMTVEQLGLKDIAHKLGVPVETIDGFRVDKQYRLAGINAIAELSERPIYYLDSPSLTATSIRANAALMRQKIGVDLVVVDYLQLLQDGVVERRFERRYEQVGFVSAQLKQLSREIKAPVLALSQLSRGVEGRDDKHPTLADLRESGNVEQDADVVMLLYRDDYYYDDESYQRKFKKPMRHGVTELMIPKNRFGPTGYIDLLWKGDIGRYVSYADGRMAPVQLHGGRDLPWS